MSPFSKERIARSLRSTKWIANILRGQIGGDLDKVAQRRHVSYHIERFRLRVPARLQGRHGQQCNPVIKADQHLAIVQNGIVLGSAAVQDIKAKRFKKRQRHRNILDRKTYRICTNIHARLPQFLSKTLTQTSRLAYFP